MRIFRHLRPWAVATAGKQDQYAKREDRSHIKPPFVLSITGLEWIGNSPRARCLPVERTGMARRPRGLGEFARSLSDVATELMAALLPRGSPHQKRRGCMALLAALAVIILVTVLLIVWRAAAPQQADASPAPASADWSG